MTKYREDVLSWDEVWMVQAAVVARRSKDPNTQVGACIVGPDNKIKATGYNGFPKKISNDKFPWARQGGVLDTKYAFMCHAESNAIDNRGSNSIEGGKIYVTLFPCNECAQRIIQNDIVEVIYLKDKYAGTEHNIASKMLLDAAGVKYRQFTPRNIHLEFENDDG